MMLDDRDHRPDFGRIDNRLTEREPPSRFRLLLVLLALSLVALGFVSAAFLDLVLIPMTVAVLS